MIGVRDIDWQGQVCIQLSQEEPRSRFWINKVGVFSQPPQPGILSQRFFHDWRAVCKCAVREGAYRLGNLVSQLLEPAPHRTVIVPPQRIAGDIGLFRITESLERTRSRSTPIPQPDTDDPNRVRNKQFWLGSFSDMTIHEVHLPMPALLQPLAEREGGLRKIGSRNTDGIEAEITRPAADILGQLIQGGIR